MKEREFGLDALRAVAIGAVVTYHTYGEAFSNGWMGVDLFFALSGYLVSGPLISGLHQAKPHVLRSFFLKRVLRTWPLYALAVVGAIVSGRVPVAPLAAYLTFTQNLFGGAAITYTWSLCVEEHFYVLLPIAALAAVRPGRAPRRAIPVFALLFLAAFGARLATMRTMSEPVDFDEFLRRIYFPTYSHYDGLLAGLVLAWVERLHADFWTRLRSKPWLAFGVGSGLIAATALMGRLSAFGCVLAFPALGVGFALWVLATRGDWSVPAWLRMPGIRTVSEISYPLYLVHPVCIRLLRGHDPVIGILASIAVAYVLHQGVERPMLALRERILVRWKREQDLGFEVPTELRDAG